MSETWGRGTYAVSMVFSLPTAITTDLIGKIFRLLALGEHKLKKIFTTLPFIFFWLTETLHVCLLSMKYVGSSPCYGKECKHPSRGLLLTMKHYILQNYIINPRKINKKINNNNKNQSTYFTKHNVDCCDPSKLKVEKPKVRPHI